MRVSDRASGSDRRTGPPLSRREEAATSRREEAATTSFTVPSPPACGPLQVIEDAYTRAFAALDDPAAPPLDLIAWLSAHLSTVQRVVHPTVLRVLGDDAALTALGRDTVLIERALRLLERVRSGDGQAIRLDPAPLTRSLVALVTAHAHAEQALLCRLGDRLPAVEQQRLLEDYRRALERAPTRPHPYMPHTGRLGAAAFALDGRRDRMMDGLDGRHVPTPRRPTPPVRGSRWSSFLRVGRRGSRSTATGGASNSRTVAAPRGRGRP